MSNNKNKQILKEIISIPKYILLGLIKIYQKTLSFDHGLAGKMFPGVKVCIYEPSCSQYGYEAVEKYGVIKGGFKATRRVLSCNPMSKGGYDPLK